MLNIIRGTLDRPLRVVAYGSEGIGKTTFASHFPDPLFIDTEDGTTHMDVPRIADLETWDELIAAVEEVAATPGICKTLVLDTADRAEQLCFTSVLDRFGKDGIESFGYGKGYTYVAEEFDKLITALNKIVASGKHVLVTAHAKMRKIEQPDEMGAYDHWELKLSKTVTPLLKEWCDLLLFMNYKTYVIETENKTKKAQGGKRVMYTTHTPYWDAKNRHGLPEMLDLDFNAIAHLFGHETAATEPESEGVPFTGLQEQTPLAVLWDLMARDDITADEVRKVVADRGNPDEPVENYEDTFITNYCIKYWDRIADLAIKNRG